MLPPHNGLLLLLLQSWHDFPAEGSAEVYLMQWVYGNVAHAPTGACPPASTPLLPLLLQELCRAAVILLPAPLYELPLISVPPPSSPPPVAAEDFLERQQLAAGSKGCDAALMDCLSELADVWRQLGAATARAQQLQELRDRVRVEAAAVRSFEEAGAAALRAQAADFCKQVGSSGGSSPRSPGGGTAGQAAGAGAGGGGGTQWSQRALGKLQHFHQLKDEGSIR